jgi:hypothetical protein
MARKYYQLIYKATGTIEKKYYIGQTSFSLASAKARHKSKAININKH